MSLVIFGLVQVQLAMPVHIQVQEWGWILEVGSLEWEDIY